MLTADQRLNRINELLNGGVGFDADCLLLDVQLGRENTKKERDFAKLIIDIYKIAHPHSGCKHEDWDSTTNKSYHKKGGIDKYLNV